MPYRRERVAPTGSTVAVIVLGDPIIETAGGPRAVPLHAERGFLIGPHDRPVTNEPTGETFAVGIVTTPVGRRAALGVDPAAVAGRVVDLMETWPAAADLRERLLVAPGPEAMLDLVVACLADELRIDVPGLDRCERAVAMLEEDPVRPISDIAAALSVSHGHLDREFTRIVGLAPRRLARLLRVERLLEAIDVEGDVPWADLAAHLGWADQSHMIGTSSATRGPRRLPTSPHGERSRQRARARSRPGSSPSPCEVCPRRRRPRRRGCLPYSPHRHPETAHHARSYRRHRDPTAQHRGCHRDERSRVRGRCH